MVAVNVNRPCVLELEAKSKKNGSSQSFGLNGFNKAAFVSVLLISPIQNSLYGCKAPNMVFRSTTDGPSDHRFSLHFQILKVEIVLICPSVPASFILIFSKIVGIN